jgi:mono/diheme cytochrome c family protein
LKLRLLAALIVGAAVLGPVLLPVRNDRARSLPAALPALEGWSAVRVEDRPFSRGGRQELAERLYGWNCMPCHGAEGKGDGPVAARLGLRPRDFSRGMFQLKSSHRDEMPFDDDLFRSITAGFPNGAMPAFGEFTAEERWALVDHVKSLAGRRFEADPPRRRIPESPAVGNPVRGARLFVSGAGCAQCHGTRGRGDGPASTFLVDVDGAPASLPDFARGLASFKAGARAQDVERVLSTGLAGTPMPSFLSLPEQDRRDLAAFVTTLYGPIATGERLFLAKGCTNCHTIGKGRRVGPDLAGVSQRRPREWLRRWLENPPAMIASDPAAREMAREYPLPMPDLRLTESEIRDLLDYLR